MLRVGTLVLMMVALVAALFSSEGRIKFAHLGLEQGLSQNTGNCILQDRKGFMWFATEDGLNKYDGYEFKTYNSDPNDPCSLSVNFTWTIYEDRSGTLWVGTWGGGLNKFDRSRECFSRYMNDPKDPLSLSNNEVRMILEDRLGVLWIATKGGGLNTFDRAAGRFKRYLNDPQDPNNLSHDEVIAILEDRSGTLWIGTNGGGLNKFDRVSGRFFRYRHEPANPGSLSHNDITSLYEDRAGILWIGTNGGGLNRFDPAAGRFDRYMHDPKDPASLSHNQVRAIYEDRFGSLWIGTNGGGLNEFNREKGTFTHYMNNPTDPDSLSSNEVRAIYEDRSGVLWVSTYGAGLNKWVRKKEKFALYKADPGNAYSLSNPIVWAIHEDRSDVLWIGTGGGGLNRFDRTSGRFVHYVNDPLDPFSLSDNHVRAIYQDRSGMLWIGTNGGGINKFDRSDGRFVRYRNDPQDPNSLSHNTIRSIYEDRFGVLWIGTGDGLNKFDRKSERFTRYLHDPDDANSLSHNFVYSIYEDRAGGFWIGTWGGGLNKLDRRTGEFTRYRTDPHNPHSLSNELVLSIYEDKSGVLWIGTSGGGLNRFDRESETFTHYRQKDGLPNDVIYGILEDTRGALWISTNKGLAEFDPATKECKNYSVVDGLQSNEFNGGAYFKSKSGEMFFGGINGFNSFSPEKLSQGSQYNPPVVITAFLMLNKEVKLAQPISEMDELRLSYRDNSFSFEFAALDYTAPERIKYAYKMEGLDKDFILTDAKKRSSDYTTLAPGKYQFLVKGTNSEGEWSKEEAAIKVIITPPVWVTWWFKALAVALALGIVLFYIRIRIKKVRLESRKERLEKELGLKRDFTAMLVHDLRSPLSSVMGYAQMMNLSPKRIDVEKAGSIILKASGKMLALIDDVLDLTKYEAVKINLNRTRITLAAIAEEIVDAAQPFLDSKRIKMVYDFTELPPLFIDHEKTHQVLDNLFSNAVKFSPEGGIITIRTKEIRRNDETLQELAVLDEGPGVPRGLERFLFDKYSKLHNDNNKKGTGLGLAISRLIVEAHTGEIGYQHRDEGGSIFYFRLPQTGQTQEARRDEEGNP